MASPLGREIGVPRQIILKKGGLDMDFALKVLGIMALASFIICSAFWVVQRPNRYQVVMAGEDPIRLDTLTGRVDVLSLIGRADGSLGYASFASGEKK